MTSEADTRAKYVDPALHERGWTEDLIKREETAGAVEIINGKPRKRAKGHVDYTLRVKVHPDNQPVAVALIEAKPEDKSPSYGLEQAKLYAACKRLNVLFVFSTNGKLYVEYDKTTGLTSSPKPMSEFPTPDELRTRYEAAMGFKLTDEVAKPLLVKYSGGEATRRYYQDAAIRAALEKIAQCEKNGQPRRVLLALATGSGKTFIAVHLLKRIADAGQLRRALLVCDRDELRNQGSGAFQNVFGSDVAKVFKEPDGSNHARNARIHVATYQTLDVDTEEGTANFLKTYYPENYFSHIVIDECHRSAWGKWSEVLLRNPEAVQIGLTATPRQLEYSKDSKEAQEDAKITADNIRHFGEPVYEYDIAKGIEDGYLAACEIQRSRVNIDDTGITIDEIMARNPKNALTGEPMTREELQELYSKTEYENKIMLPDRVYAMCRDFFNYLLETGGPEQKTIIFCVRDYHAEAVAAQMNNLYAEWCKEQDRPRLEPYAFKCTASVGGSAFVADLRGMPRSHFIATTVELLTTGVDVPIVRNIVFFKYVKSPIAFYQMLGRGTRLHLASGKLMFRVYDYTNATRLFGSDFITRLTPRGEVGEPLPQPLIIEVEGFEVRVNEDGQYILAEKEGKAQPVTVEAYKARLAERLIEEAPTLEEFRTKWIVPGERRELIAHLPEGGRSTVVIQELERMVEYDLFDVLAELGYKAMPLTKSERSEAFAYNNKEWLDTLPQATREALLAIIEQFARAGTEGLESPHIFKMPEVVRAGGLKALKALGKPEDVLLETKRRMFAA